MRRETTSFSRDGVRWLAVAEFVPLLDAVLASPAEVIKESAPKLVTRHQTDGRVCFVKRYRHGAFLLRPFKFLLKRSQAKQEWDMAAACEAGGIPIVPHLALGERWTRRGLVESILVTGGFDGEPLGPQHEAHFSAVVEFVKDLARAKMVHHDFHPANLLLNPARGELRLLDLHGMKHQPGASFAEMRDRMLVQLCMSLALPVDEVLFRAGQAERMRALSKRSRRCLKSNRDFAVKELGGLRWHVRRETLTPEVEAVLRDPDGFLARARLLKAGRSSTVGAADGLVLKRYNFRRWSRPLKDLLRESRAQAGFRRSYHLELNGIATPRVLAAADERALGMVRRGFVLMEEVSGGGDLATFSGDLAVAAGRVGHLIASLHGNGFSHRDLKPGNVLFREDGRPVLVDLDGLRFRLAVPPAVMAQNLARLAGGAAQSGRLDRRTVFRFLRTYGRGTGLRPRDLFPRS
jgi:RIO-like serine/threonine protein kinase